MTRSEQIDLVDALTTIAAAVERAQVLMDVLLDGYFSKHDSDTDRGKTAITYDFKRMGTFAVLLRDQLIAIERELPDPDYVDELKVEEDDE